VPFSVGVCISALKAKTGSIRDDFARDGAATKDTLLQPMSVTSVCGVRTIGTGIYDVVVNNYGGFRAQRRRRQKNVLSIERNMHSSRI
jgi:hypothetical protein